MITAERGISDTLRSYETALNASDTDAVLQLYAPDAVFMPQDLPTFVGSEAIRKSYDMISMRIALSLAFTVFEARAISDRWGFARTSSAGKQQINATGETTDDANHELFVIENIDGRWLIRALLFLERTARRMSSTTSGDAFMRAAVIREPGGPNVLKVEQLPIPIPLTGWVRVRIKAFGINRSEMLVSTSS